MAGDGELQEGQNYEGAPGGRARTVSAGSGRRRPQRGAIGQAHRRDRLPRGARGEAPRFGWHVASCDGHDHAALRGAFGAFSAARIVRRRSSRGRSRARASRSWSIPSRSRDGGGTYRWHAGAPDDERFARAFAELEARDRRRLRGARPCAARARASRRPMRRPRRAARGRAGVRCRASRPRSVLRDEYVVDAYGDELCARSRARGPRRPRRRPRVRLPHPRLRARVSGPLRRVRDRRAGHGLDGGRASRGTGCCPSSTRSRRSSRRARTSRSTTRRARARRSIYALHYAGLIPAGPGKSHQSIRDISLLGALPDVDDRPARQRGGDARAPALGGRGSGGERRDPPRDRPVAAADRAARRASRSDAAHVLREGERRGAPRIRAGDAARGTHRLRAPRRARRARRSRSRTCRG